MTYIRYHPDKIYVEHDAAEYPVTQDILSKLSHLEPNYIDAISAVEQSASERALILARQKGDFYKRCPGTKKYICCGYKILNLVNNCELNCSYCVLQGYFNANHIIIYVNIEDLFAELTQLRNTYPSQIFRIGTGELADSLSTDHLTDYSAKLVSFFANQQNMILELKTKTNLIENFITVPHNGRTVAAWSLNTPQLIATEETDSPGLEQRLKAAQKCQDAGFRIAFHFDPMIYYPNWEKEYKQTVDAIFDYVRPDSIIWISLGALRYPPHVDQIIRERHPESDIVYGELLPGTDGKYRYFKQIRINMFRSMYQWIKRYHNDMFVYLCMESSEVWQKSFGWNPKTSGGLAKRMDQLV